ncbi:unnamed protein product, partial [Protopolystoma xenopodis]
LWLCHHYQLDIFFYDTSAASLPRLSPIPVLNRALIGENNLLVNQLDTTLSARVAAAASSGSAAAASSVLSIAQDNWQLTRRFFMVDNVAGKTVGNTNCKSCLYTPYTSV